jgi:AGCS family alanine or glycine:cation symporter
MALLWVAASLFVAALHIDQVPGVIATIFKSAFGWRKRPPARWATPSARR